MRWNKLGRIYKPVGRGWRKSHGFTPTPFVMEDRVRIFAGFWGKDGKSRIGYVDVEKDNPTKVLGISEYPIVELGEDGYFDSDAMIPSFVAKSSSGKTILSYTGWQKLEGKMKRLAFSGAIISEDGGNTFRRYRRTPILDRTEEEPFLRTMPIIVEDYVIYIGASIFNNIHGWNVPKYSVRVLDIGDAFTVPKTILEVPEGFIGVARPTIAAKRTKENQDDVEFNMWASLRELDKGYKKIVHAVSTTVDGQYILDENLQLEVSKEKDWDSEMVCFPAIYIIEDDMYMIYCGNDYGKTGFGVAKLIGD